MARATFVKAAAKDYPEHGIKKGESYWWWKFRYGGKRYSKTQPRGSQLTQSAFYQAVREIEERISDLEADENLASARDEIVSDLESLRDEQEEKRGNMPEALQDSDTGNMLQERYDALDAAIDELSSISIDEWEATKGSEIDPEDLTDADDPVCEKCGESERHKLDCEHNEEDESVNDEGDTETSHYESILEEIQAVSIDAP